MVRRRSNALALAASVAAVAVLLSAEQSSAASSSQALRGKRRRRRRRRAAADEQQQQQQQQQQSSPQSPAALLNVGSISDLLTSAEEGDNSAISQLEFITNYTDMPRVPMTPRASEGERDSGLDSGDGGKRQEQAALRNANARRGGGRGHAKTPAQKTANNDLADANATSTSTSTSTASNEANRIVGGIDSTHQRPWFACTLDYQNGVPYMGGCGAVVIGTRHLLTAAHCVSNSYDNDLLHKMDGMYIGCYAPYAYGPTGQPNKDMPKALVNVVSVQVHPDHSPRAASTYDMALVTVDRDINTNGLMGPPLAVCSEGYMNALPPNAGVTVLGLGQVAYQGAKSQVLKEVTVPLVPNAACADRMKSMATIDESMLCAGGGQDGKDACGGDSGGPLVSQDPVTGETCLAGLVSWGYKCAEANYPGVYSRPHAPKAMAWLKSKGVAGLVVKNGASTMVTYNAGVTYNNAISQHTITTTTTTPSTINCTQNDSQKFTFDKNGKEQKNKTCSQVKSSDCDYNINGSTGKKVADVCPKVCYSQQC